MKGNVYRVVAIVPIQSYFAVNVEMYARDKHGHAAHCDACEKAKETR